MNKTIITISFAFFSLVWAFCSEITGTIVMTEGYVDIYRNGEVLDYQNVDIGLEIKEYDMVETGSDGYVEIEIETPGNSGTMIRIVENTAFYFSSETLNSGKKTTIDMLSGSLSLVVDKLRSNNAFDVRTQSAVMGVRGTEFKVILAPEQSLLVTCSEGKVEVAEESGLKVHSEPGQIALKSYDSSLLTNQVRVQDLENFESSWFLQREDLYKRGAKTFISYYSGQYKIMLPKFLKAYEKLDKVSDILKTYGADSNALRGDKVRTKQKAGDAVIAMRTVLPMFEHVFYAVQTLDRYHDLGYGKGKISKKLSSVDFFTSYKSEKQSLKNKLAEVRYLYRLYMNLDTSEFGKNDLVDDMLQNSRHPKGSKTDMFKDF